MANNIKIRVALAERGLKQYDLARILGISEPACSVLLRDELPPERTQEILQLISGAAE